MRKIFDEKYYGNRFERVGENFCQAEIIAETMKTGKADAARKNIDSRNSEKALAS